MRMVFQGRSDEYELETSSFCKRAFVIRDRVENRDGIALITDNVVNLEFKDESFDFDEILQTLEERNDENTIIIEDFLRQDPREEAKALHLKNSQFKIVTFPSRIFSQANFILGAHPCDQREDMILARHNKLEIFKNLKHKHMQVSFVKLEISSYDHHNDSISFNLEAFPSGLSYKYSVYDNCMHIILQGKISTPLLFEFLKTFIYKNKNAHLCEKKFVLMFNDRLVYELRVHFI